jgi:glycosyltransferase involved in cell wall biosynthesis
LRVAFLIEELGRSGGMSVIRRHARHLLDREGADVSLVVCWPKHSELPEVDDGIPVTGLAEARRERYDVAIATWWRTTEALFELAAGRRAVFLQSFEHRFYRAHERPDRLGALGVLDLPVDYLVVGSAMRRVLERLRPDSPCHVVPCGIDKAVFTARTGQPPDGPLRVLIEGQPSLWFKGIGDAVAATRAMREPATVTLAALDAEAARAEALPVDRVVGGLTPEGMAALYAEHDVLLKLSRNEGLALPPLEAMHVGLPSVLTPFMGNEDYARHGENALIVGFDDNAATAAALDLLARDRDLTARLSAGALASASRWPSREAASRVFAEAVRDLAASPPPELEPALRRLMRGRRLAVELGREDQRRDGVRLAHTRSEADSYLAALGEWQALAQDRLEMIYDLTGRPSYRAALFAKRLVGRGEPR